MVSSSVKVVSIKDFLKTEEIILADTKQSTKIIQLGHLNFKLTPDIVKSIKIRAAEAFYKEGMLYLYLQKSKAALNSFNKALFLEPNNVLFLLYKGCSHYISGHYELAIEFLNKAIKFNPKYITAYYTKGNALYFLGRYKEAIKVYDFIIKHNSVFLKAYYDKALALRELGEYSKAIKVFNSLINKDPHYIEAYIEKAEIFKTLGKYHDAIKTYDEIILLHPERSEIHLAKANALIQIQQESEAIDSINIAIKLEPNNIRLYYEKGKILQVLGNHEEAIEIFDNIISYKRHYAWVMGNMHSVYYAKALSLYSLNKIENTIKVYDEIIALNPNCLEAYSKKGLLLDELGRSKEATEVCHKILEIDPEHSSAFLLKSQYINGVNQQDRATESQDLVMNFDTNYDELRLEKALKLKSLDKKIEALAEFDSINIDSLCSKSCWEMAYALEDFEEYQKAIKVYNKIIELEPTNAIVYYKRGKNLNALNNRSLPYTMKVKNYKEASKAFAKSIEFGFELIDLYEDLCLALRGSGEYQKAIEIYNKIAKLDPKNTFVYVNIGLCLLFLGQKSQSLKKYDKMISRLASNIQGVVKYLTCDVKDLFEDRKYKEALEVCNWMIDLDPGSIEGYYFKGETLLILTEYQEALELFDKVIEMDPQNVGAYNMKGDAFMGLLRHSEAIEMYMNGFEKDIQLNKYSLEIECFLKGKVFIKCNKHKKAIEMFEEAIKLGLDNVKEEEAYHLIAMCIALIYFDDIYPNEGRQYMLKCQNYYGVGTLDEMFGEWKAAIKFYDQAIERHPNDVLAYLNKEILLEKINSKTGTI